MNKKILILGIDSLDRNIITKYDKLLPNITSMMKNGNNVNMKGVFPPDSPTSWASIYTGYNPSKHGVIHFIDPLEKTGHLINNEIENRDIVGNTFWDIAGKNGKKVFIFCPLLCYPPWKVNGTMIGRATSSNEVIAIPNISDDLSLLSGLKGLPGRNPTKFVDKAKILLENEVNYAIKYMNNYEWDIFFFYTSVIDPIQHNFWNCFDNTDPTYKPGNRYENTILDFYKQIDNYIGVFKNNLDDDTVLVLMSDHGHMKRPLNMVNINQLLQQKGYLSIKKNRQKISIKNQIYKKRHIFMDIITKYGLGAMALKIIKIIPQSKSAFSKPDSIDWNNTIAHVSDLSGIKSYTYGGIVIRKNLIDEKNYETIREDIIETIKSIKDPSTNLNLFKYVEKRENYYNGEHVNKYPDILFEFIDNYGAGWAIENTFLSICDSHNIQPGSHNIETPTFILYPKISDIEEEGVLMDIYPTLLDILGIKYENRDGHSLVVYDEVT